MKTPVLVFSLLLTMLCVPAWSDADNFYNGGPTSPYYIESRGEIYIVSNGGPFLQPLVQKFSPVYGGDESVLAVSCSTSSCSDLNSAKGVIRTGGYGADGEYTLSGTATGVSYNVSYDDSTIYDGTAGKRANYFIDHWSGIWSTDSHWQNPKEIVDFGWGATGIAYDPYSGTLWVSWGPNAYLSEYSTSGKLLREIGVDSGGNTGLAFDPADHTLWMIKNFAYGDTAYLEQYTTSGQLLQSGYIDAIPHTYWTAGEMAELAPEPGTLLLMATSLLGVAEFARRKRLL